MNRESNPCPEPEMLAAFAAGNLSVAELEMTAEHLRQCRECRRTVAEAVRLEPLSQALRPPKRLSRLPLWFAAAAALAGVGYVSVSAIRSSRASAPMRALVAATPADGRDVEPRVSGGFPWAPLRPTQRGHERLTASQMKLVGAAGKVIEETANDPAPAARHAAAIARLLSGTAGHASSELSALAQSTRDAAVWNDLAAALYTEATRTDAGKPKLAQALAAADAALRADATHAEALFNRALILERLGLREQARIAWKRYLAVDSGSPWAAEAEEHVRRLGGVTSLFPDELGRVYIALRNDPNADARSLVARFPQECRVWGESEILRRWADAEKAGDARNAAVHLRLARSFGDELARSRGEGLLRAAVAVIQQASAEQRRILADAHIRLRQAQVAQKAKEPARAERLFTEAAEMFEKGDSPMALVARYFAAIMAYEQERIDEAQTRLEQVLFLCRSDFKANIAGIQWQLGLVHVARGRWGRALESLNLSIGKFQELNESQNASFVREIMAATYDRIGETQKAWSHRLAVLHELGHSGSSRLQVAIHSVARSAALNQNWAVALSFADLQNAMAWSPGDELLYVHTLLLRATVLGRMGRSQAARSDLLQASAAIPAIRDVARRERAESEFVAVEGFLATSPSAAVGALSRAIDYQRTKGRRMFLPELLLYRGRAHAALGQRDQAAEDLEAGIRELETQRVSLAPGDERWGMFGTADELFDEAVVLALDKGDVPGAFAYSERARARELLDARGVMTASSVPPSWPDAVILEYVQLPDRMIIFVIDHGRLRVMKEELPRAVVSNEIERLINAATNGKTQEFKRLANVLYDRLLRPVAAELAASSTLVVIPDGTLSHVPFAALVDSEGRYVVERRVVVVTPSVGVISRTATHPQRFSPASRLLMIAGPAAREGDLGTLAAEQREIESVAAAYGGNVDHAPVASMDEEFQRRVSGADVIHFVGHAVLPGEDSGGALVTAQGDQLDVREIASMQLRNIGLVVLAACGTARGNGRAGEASVSVARAFLAAGVPSVVATLWPIEDGPAAEFFPRFHHYLLQGSPPAEALRAVQLDWIRRNDGSPGVWAAIQMIGT